MYLSVGAPGIRAEAELHPDGSLTLNLIDVNEQVVATGLVTPGPDRDRRREADEIVPAAWGHQEHKAAELIRQRRANASA